MVLSFHLQDLVQSVQLSRKQGQAVRTDGLVVVRRCQHVPGKELKGPRTRNNQTHPKTLIALCWPGQELDWHLGIMGVRKRDTL